MKDYYQILKIPRSASANDIKKAFRSLAVKYHPDKNLKGNTVAQFQEVNEAYEHLGDIDKKIIYDQKYDYYYSPATYRQPTQTTTYTPPYGRPRYASRRPTTSTAGRSIDFSSYAPFFDKINWIGFILCVLLLLDFIFTIRYPNQEIKAIGGSEYEARYYTRGGQPVDLVVNVHTDQFTLKVDQQNTDNMEVGDKLDVYITPLFKIARWIEFKTKPIAASPHYGIYNNFIFLPFLLLIFSSLGLFLQRGARFIVDMGVTVFFFIILTSIFIAIS